MRPRRARSPTKTKADSAPRLIQFINSAKIVKNFTNFSCRCFARGLNIRCVDGMLQNPALVQPIFYGDKNVDAGGVFITITDSREHKLAFRPDTGTVDKLACGPVGRE